MIFLTNDIAQTFENLNVKITLKSGRTYDNYTIETATRHVIAGRWGTAKMLVAVSEIETMIVNFQVR